MPGGQVAVVYSLKDLAGTLAGFYGAWVTVRPRPARAPARGRFCAPFVNSLRFTRIKFHAFARVKSGLCGAVLLGRV